MYIVKSRKEWMQDQTKNRMLNMFERFLNEFSEDHRKPKYVDVAVNMLNSERFTLEVSFLDVEKFNKYLALTIIEDFSLMYPALCVAVAQFIFQHTNADGGYHDYFVCFVDVTTRFNLRELTINKIGHLVRISGHVVKTYPFHPELISGYFTCQDCQVVEPNVEQKFKYTEPYTCNNPYCANRRRFILNIKKSRFMDIQKIRIQECQSELPRGSIPRSLDVFLKNENVETVQVGDRYNFTGTLIVVPDVGVMSTSDPKAESASRQKIGDENERNGSLNCLGVKDINNKLSFLACCISATSSRFVGNGKMHDDELSADSIEHMKKKMTGPQLEKINEMNRDENLCHNLINSLFPTIHGNDQIKIGVLLMLFGGVPKTTSERTNLRGDINCCIVGDPGTVKSQFLKEVAEMFPCAVYTSAKATTGFSADVVKDGESSDFVIRAGALVLADNGVCCIDKFDKITLCNQIAIREAMEQQTISIEKEGVNVKLNARTSILVAANPINGRYERSKSLRQNVTLSPEIISRFDLFYVLIDESNEVDDRAITKQIIEIYADIEDTIETFYSEEDILLYIGFARQFKPQITAEASKKLVTAYTQLRQYDSQYSRKSTWSITVRHLQSLIRLSEALAKMKCSDYVTPEDVLEAYSLLKKSIIRVEEPYVNLDDDLLNRTAEPDGMDAGPNGEPEKQNITKINLPHSFEEYKRITNMIVVYIRSEVVKRTSKTSASGNCGLLRSEIINWYMDKIKYQIKDVPQLVENQNIIGNILDRLINYDNILIALSKDTEDDDPVLNVHPNFVSKLFSIL